MLSLAPPPPELSDSALPSFRLTALEEINQALTAVATRSGRVLDGELLSAMEERGLVEVLPKAEQERRYRETQQALDECILRKTSIPTETGRLSTVRTTCADRLASRWRRLLSGAKSWNDEIQKLQDLSHEEGRYHAELLREEERYGKLVAQAGYLAGFSRHGETAIRLTEKGLQHYQDAKRGGDAEGNGSRAASAG